MSRFFFLVLILLTPVRVVEGFRVIWKMYFNEDSWRWAKSLSFINSVKYLGFFNFKILEARSLEIFEFENIKSSKIKK